jgi:hypothetical protein
MNLYSLKPHQLSKMFPAISGQDLTAVRDTIKAHGGPWHPVWIFQDQILDGNQRIFICRELRIHEDKIPYQMFEGTWEQACQFVYDSNLARRQLNAAQRVLAVKDYYRFLVLGDVQSQRNQAVKNVGGTNVPPLSNIETAEKAETSLRTVKEVKFVIEHAENPKKIVEELKSGKRDLHQTYQETKSKSTGRPEDKMGNEIPDGALEYWERRVEIEQIMYHASELRTLIRKIQDGDLLYHRVGNRGNMARDVDSIYNVFTGVLPSYVCGDCKGQLVKNGKVCEACLGIGLLSAYFDEQCLPPEKRANARA